MESDIVQRPPPPLVPLLQAAEVEGKALRKEFRVDVAFARLPKQGASSGSALQALVAVAEHQGAAQRAQH